MGIGFWYLLLLLFKYSRHWVLVKWSSWLFYHIFRRLHIRFTVRMHWTWYSFTKRIYFLLFFCNWISCVWILKICKKIWLYNCLYLFSLSRFFLFSVSVFNLIEMQENRISEVILKIGHLYLSKRRLFFSSPGWEFQMPDIIKLFPKFPG